MSRFKKLFLIKTPISCLALLVALVFTLTLPGCGGGGGGSRDSGKDVMIMPPENSAPTVGRAFANLSLIHESGNPGRWRSNSLDTHFSDPDSDSLSYTASSSNQSVAGAAIDVSGTPILAVETQGVGTAVITVTAADPDGLTVSHSFTVTVDEITAPPPDHSDTLTGATPVALDKPFTGRIDSPTDVDYFRLPIDNPGKLTIRTTGGANPDIAVFDADGVEIPGNPGSWVVSITPAILSIRLFVFIRFSSGNPGQDYSGSATFEPNPAQSWGAVGSIPDQTLGRTSATNIFALSQYFSYPRPTDLRFTATSADPGLVNTLFSALGAHDFGLFSHSRLGSTSVTVTATDPFGQTATQTFTVTVENRAPVADIREQFTQPYVTLNFVGVVDEMREYNIDSYFFDPDGDELSYTVDSSNSGAVQAVIIHSSRFDALSQRRIVTNTLKISKVQTARDSEITVTATDPYGASVTRTFIVVVHNHPPKPVRDAIPDPLVMKVEICKSVTLNLSGFFEDPDGDTIAYDNPPEEFPFSSYPQELLDNNRILVARANITGSTLTISGLYPGYTTHTIYAYNPHAYMGRSSLFSPNPKYSDSGMFGMSWGRLFPEVEIEVTGEKKKCEPDEGGDKPDDGGSGQPGEGGDKPDDGGSGQPGEGDDKPDDGDNIFRAGAYILFPRLFVSVSHPTFEENANAVLQECEAQRNPDEEPCDTLPVGIMGANICLASALGETATGAVNDPVYITKDYIGQDIRGSGSASAQEAENNALDICRNYSQAEPETCRIEISGICGFGL